jgi:RHS repeat-associated protein
MGRRTSWQTDVQGRLIAKHFPDGSRVTDSYETTTSRLQRFVDEALQTTTFMYYRDDQLKSVGYANTTIPTPGVTFTYDADYARVISMTDGPGTTLYSYLPIMGASALGAGRLASVDGPLPNDTIMFGYDELGRLVSTDIDGVATLQSYDAAGRIVSETNALGTFTFAYDGASSRVLSETFPNGENATFAYGDNLQDRSLQQATFTIGASPISQFTYQRDIPAGRITNWSQQSGAQPPSIFSLGYDAVNQLLSATVTNSGALVNAFAYNYDAAGNRLSEQVGTSHYPATYNALNQLSTGSTPGTSRTNEWDGANRLVAVNAGNQRTEFTYDGLSRIVGIRQLLNGSEISHRRFVWSGRQIREERDASGSVVTKRFFRRGMKLETGPVTGPFFYARDHLGSIHELTDSGGNIRARYAYDPYGRRTKLTGDLDSDFGFTGMFWASEANLSLTHFRAYDPDLGRWLSRDPLRNAEVHEGPNLYAYVRNQPINHVDPEGLALTTVDAWCEQHPVECAQLSTALGAGGAAANRVAQTLPGFPPPVNNAVQCFETAITEVQAALPEVEGAVSELVEGGEATGEEVALTGKELEDWLLQNGEIGGNSFGPIAKDILWQTIQKQMEFLKQVKGSMPISDAIEWAEQKTIEFFGFDTDKWIN